MKAAHTSSIPSPPTLTCFTPWSRLLLRPQLPTCVYALPVGRAAPLSYLRTDSASFSL